MKLFIGLWFQDKGSEIAKFRESNQINLNTKDIVVVQLIFVLLIIFDFTSESRGSKIDIRKVPIFFLGGGDLLDITHRS